MFETRVQSFYDSREYLNLGEGLGVKLSTRTVKSYLEKKKEKENNELI